MSGWTPHELQRIGEATELELASRRPDGTLRPHVTMWVVRNADDLYVRSAHGSDNPWYRRALTSGIGHVRAGGVDAEVNFTSADDADQSAIDDAYHAKYDSYGPRIVGTVVGPNAHDVTIRLERSTS
jgi:hypothetical protein